MDEDAGLANELDWDKMGRCEKKKKKVRWILSGDQRETPVRCSVGYSRYYLREGTLHYTGLSTTVLGGVVLRRPPRQL